MPPYRYVDSPSSRAAAAARGAGGPTMGMGAEIKALTRDPATDAFWAGRWSGMASALARALRNVTTGEAELLAEFDWLWQQFGSPAFIVGPPEPPDV